MRASPRISFSLRSGFTLVELLVSMAILSVIVVMLAGFLNGSLGILSGVQSDGERHRSGRALTDFIGRELRQAMLPVEGLTTTTGAGTGGAVGADLQLLVNPRGAVSDDNYYNCDAVFWQAPLATENTYGDIAEVGYFVKWIDNGSTSTPTLCRFFVNPSKKNKGSDTVAPNPDFLIYTKGVSWLSKELLDSVAPADNLGTGDDKHGYVGLFADNVIGLWVRSFGLDNSEPASDHRVYDSRIGYDVKNGPSPLTVTQKHYLPAMMKISIAQVDSKYAGRLSAAKGAIQSMVNQAVDATAFYAAAKAAADNSSALRALYPGIRIYSTDVYLDSGK